LIVRCLHYTLIFHYTKTEQLGTLANIDVAWLDRCLLDLNMGLLDAAVAVDRALAINVNVGNLRVITVEDASNLLESRATGKMVSFEFV
jgi:hypothetical protein